MSEPVGHFIGNERVPASGDATAPIHDPATGTESGRVGLGTAADVDRAVAAATAAWPGWSDTPVLRRARVLDRFKSILWERAEQLAEVISAEHGKTRDDALGEVTRGLEVVEFAVGAPHLMKGEFSEDVGGGVDSHSIRQSLGVVAGITPFNFPVMVPMWMFPTALVAGNAFVLKPSERVPSASLLVAEWLAEAGLPPGVFNVVQGDRTAVEALLEHPDVRAVSFVGSTPVAKAIHERASSNGKRVQALGGAKNHMIVMPDADLDAAANALMGAAFGSAGERCMAISVAVPVTDKVADALVERLVPKVEALKVGPASDRSSEMGPLISGAHLDKVRGLIASGVEAGAEAVIDGRETAPRLQGHENGYFIGGTLLDRVTPEMRVWQEEIFGPVLSVVRRDSYAHALELIHAHPYANGTSIFTRDGDTARNFSRDVEVGMVGVNVPIPVPMAFHSFGGWKASMFGDHHMHGMEGMRFYTRIKTTTTRWPSGLRTDPEFTMPTLG